MFKQSTREDYLDAGYSHLQVVYDSTWSYERNKEHFNDYLKEGGWQTLHSNDGRPDSAVIEAVAVIDAVKDNDGLRIIVVKLKNSTEVQLSFRKNGRNTLEKTE